jgi:hypothetical protein
MVDMLRFGRGGSRNAAFRWSRADQTAPPSMAGAVSEGENWERIHHPLPSGSSNAHSQPARAAVGSGLAFWQSVRREIGSGVGGTQGGAIRLVLPLAGVVVATFWALVNRARPFDPRLVNATDGPHRDWRELALAQLISQGLSDVRFRDLGGLAGLFESVVDKLLLSFRAPARSPKLPDHSDS